MPHSKILNQYHRCHSVSTDTRKLREGDLFFALRGDNFNGNKFAAKAVAAGAAMVVLDDPEFHQPSDPHYVLVEDSLLALQELARDYRQEFDIPFLAITGTNGKTTTKELIHAVISKEKGVHATAGNLNNHIGVPLTLLSMPRDTEIAVIEMGANKHGDIAELCDIALPTHGMITNIGRAHLERFGDIDGVQVTKGEMFDFIRANGGTAFVNLNDGRVRTVAEGIGKRVSYGDAGDYRITSIELLADRTVLEIALGKEGPNQRFESVLIGSHNAENILAAVAVGAELGISIEAIVEGIAGYVPRINRTQLIRHGDLRILLDAYNANPSSMEATIRSLVAQDYGKMALVLGDMFELGASSARLHRELVEFVGQTVPEALLIGVGAEMCAAMGDEGRSYVDAASAMDHIAEDLRGVDFVLIKGSRGMALERLLPALGVSSQ